jgi:hypothetical protein
MTEVEPQPQSPTIKKADIQRILDVLAIGAGILWIAAGFLPVLDEGIGFLAWVYAFLFPIIGFIVTIANVHVILSFWDAILSIRTGRHRNTRYNYLAFPCFLISLLWLMLFMFDSGSSGSDPSIGETDFNFGVYIYIASTILSLTRIVLVVWHRRTTIDQLTSGA